ncbi:hypothetical protein [Carboxylicivirga taeanensis]|uniref:hypothetical protein n=1 Tax=Carboxylicivirga taeanensis TaxID=1416875 RepID=UPI003F6E28F3
MQPTVVPHKKNKNMRVFSLLILISLSLTSNGQTTLSYEKIIEGLMNSEESTMISFYSYQLEQESELYFIDLINNEVLTEPPLFDSKTKKQLTADIETNSLERKLIINYLRTNNLLDSLYVRVNQSYINIETPKDNFELSEPLVIIEIMHGLDNTMMQTFVKIEDENQCERILLDISEILKRDNSSYFKQYREGLRRLKKK